MTVNVEILYKKITRTLLSPTWLKKNTIDKSLVENHIKSTFFKDTLTVIAEKNSYSCKNVLILCEKIMAPLANNNVPKDWLSYLFKYTLNKSFPNAVTMPLEEDRNISCELFLKVLRIFCEVEKISGKHLFKTKYPLDFLTENEERELEDNIEYKKFIKAFKYDCIYEMMKLSEEVQGFNTLDHICGVHYLALFISRQLKEKGLTIDMGRVSGAAAGHDVGKYGCKGPELKRVPHLHYYYTDIWFKKFSINYIRNIAINHSTWDLELENLSLESLVLIYCDFRIKNHQTSDGYEMHIFSLEESFKVIMEKLENLDAAKERRYKRVYAKLKDFEDFMVDLGINTDVDKLTEINISKNSKYYSLMHGNKIIENIKYLSINHNINLMHLIRDEHSLDRVLEKARSEKDWKNLREYIKVLKEYSTYLTQKQKMQTMNFLYDNLIHPEDDIRRKCASLLGILIAFSDEEYTKEIPEEANIYEPEITSTSLLKKYLNMFIYPKNKSIPIHRTWIGYSTRIMIKSLFKSCRKNMIIPYRDIVIDYYNNKNFSSTESQLFLLEAAKYIPYHIYTDNLDILFQYILNMLKKRNTILRISALEVVNDILHKIPREEISFRKHLCAYLENNCKKSKIPVENYLKYHISKKLNLTKFTDTFEKYQNIDLESSSDIFLTNLKSATNWVIKKNQIDLLVKYAVKHKEDTLHTTIHFCNLLKVSEIETVRSRAGIAILKLMPYLSFVKRNEVAVELLRALEIEGQRFTEYIPKYLGQVLLWLKPKELDEVIEDLMFKIKSSHPNLKTLILKTIGVLLSHYPVYLKRFEESNQSYNNRLINLISILLNGLGDYKVKVQQSAISVIGKNIFGSNILSLKHKNYIFKLMGKKLLTLITNSDEKDLLFLSNSAALTHIYRFISDHTFFIGNIGLEAPSKIAFFPGTFDPFSLSHNQIAKAIRDLGFEVYLAVDEFSWSKRTLPNLLRRKIISMSIANELNIYIFPGEIQTNISNKNDLKRLREIFNPSEVHMVAGADVVLNASSYRKKILENSIQTFPHIIFKRGQYKNLDESLKNITGGITLLSLSSQYKDISSTQIRNCIDDNRAISNLIDPLAESYIYDNGFYQREPLDKFSPSSSNLSINTVEEVTEEITEELCSFFKNSQGNIYDFLNDFKLKDSARMIIIKDKLKNNEIVAFSTFYWVRSNNLYKEVNNDVVCDYIRSNAKGRMIYINSLYVKNKDKYNTLEQILITETLAFSISHDYEYALFKANNRSVTSSAVDSTLKLQGFIEIKSTDSELPFLVVDMSRPSFLNLDMHNALKEPYRSNSKVNDIIYKTRIKLKEALTKLYPGELVLSFDNDVMHQSLINLVCKENNVPTEVQVPRKLGDAMCVPYGDILDRYILPNTVTKSLHIEKVFEPNMKGFKIVEFPYYLSMKNQVRMINSFNREVILVDKFLHKGYRMRALDPKLKNENLSIKSVIVGVLSGKGKDLMDKQDRVVKSVYYIPRLKLWFNETDLYPFIGGDALWRHHVPTRNLLPSINLILPYTYPAFIRNTPRKNIQDFSRVCLNNAMKILSSLENEYYEYNSRNLNLSNMGQVLMVPRVPEHGKGMDYDLSLSPSYYLENDIELLNRLGILVE